MLAKPESDLTLFERLRFRLEREKRARVEAERLLEEKSLELYGANMALLKSANELEKRVLERTDALQEAHNRAVEAASRDALTGLANRSFFNSEARRTLANGPDGDSTFAFVVIDIDNFKSINDTFGHEAGDAMLVHAAHQFKTNLRDTDIVARTGGDEFCAMVHVTKGSHAQELVDRLVNALAEPVKFGNLLIPLGASTGFSMFPEHGQNFEELIRHADFALYQSKHNRRGCSTAFDTAMMEALANRQQTERNIRAGLDAQAFEPWFQPIVDAGNYRIAGMEALARWRRDDGQIAQPKEFLDIIEECGWMSELFSQILTSSLVQLKPMMQRKELQYFTINVSPSQFRAGNLTDTVLRAVADNGFPADRWVLEITEEVLLSNEAQAIEQIKALNAGGVRLALDDFGNGYANIGYLQRLPFHKLKLDRSLTADVVENRRTYSIVRAVADLARALGLTLIAEGVETSSQARILQAAGCGYLQGYFFGRPCPLQ